MRVCCSTAQWLYMCSMGQGPRSNFEIGGGGEGGTISDSILGGGAQNTFSY